MPLQITSEAVSGLGHEFRDPALLERALRHRSVGAPHNERLEFLGDALLGAIIAEALWELWPRADEGQLTRARSALVRESSLADLARDFGMGESLALGPGEMKSGGMRRDSILADAFEAVVAAVFLDAGWQVCRAQVRAAFASRLAQVIEKPVAKDSKTVLQEWLQARRLSLPEYELLDATGPDHDRLFTVRCRVGDPECFGDATAGSRKLAETTAAALVCAQLGIAAPEGVINE